jgi:hypothetical protein
MIPIYHVKIFQDLKPIWLSIPPNSIIKHRGNLINNREYADPRGFDWQDYDDILPFEETALANAKKADTIDEFFEALDDETDNVNCSTLADLGVSSTAIALVSLGYLKNKKGKYENNCIPITSYRGGTRLHSEEIEEPGFYPSVAGFATPMFGEKLLSLVKGRHIGLTNIELEGIRGFELYAENLEDLFNFGKFLYTLKED